MPSLPITPESPEPFCGARRWRKRAVIAVLGLILGPCVEVSFKMTPGIGSSIASAGPASRLYQGQTIEEWQERIKSEPLPLLGAPQTVTGLLEIIEDPNAEWTHRRQVALTLGRIGAPAKTAIPALIRLLNSGEPDAETTRLWALRALSLFGPIAADATPAITPIVTDSSLPFATRATAIEALSNVGQARPETLPVLIKIVTAPEEDSLHQIAVEGMGLLKSHAAPALPVLLRALQTESALLQRAIAQTIGEMGAAAEVAVPGLVDLVFSSEHGEVQEAAVDSLAKIGPDGTRALLHLLNEEEPALRELGLRGLRALSPTPDVIAALIRSLEDPDSRLQISAAAILLKYGNAESQATRTAICGLSADDRHTRLAAYRLLTDSLSSSSLVRSKLRELEADSSAPEAARLSARKILRQVDARP